MRWLALVLGIFVAVLWGFGGWNSPAVVVGSKDQSLFFLGLVIIAAYLPLYFWRSWQDRKHGLKTGRLIDVTDLLGPAGEALEPQVGSSFENEGV
jgi:hypothetical protein